MRLNDLHGYLTAALAFLLPVSKKFVPPLIALWLILSIILIVRNRKQSTKIVAPGFAALALLVAYYLLNLLWLPLSDDVPAAKFNLEIKASFFILPVVWMFLPNIQLRERFNVLLAFIWGSIVFAFVSLIRAGVGYFETQDVASFFYGQLAWFFHPTYLAVYEAFGLVVLGRMYSRKMFALGSPWIHHLASGLLVLHIALLSSKAGYLGALLALMLVTLLLIRKKKVIQAIVYLLLNTALFTSIVGLSPDAKRRLEEVNTAAQVAANDEVPAESSSSGRVVAWKAALSVLLEHPEGVGTGDVTNELKKVYLEEGEKYAYEKELNPHNQFLQSAVEFGWLGMLIMLLMFIAGLRVALVKRDFLFTSFLMLCALNMLFESFLEVQSGVVFFAFFYTFFIRSETDFYRPEEV